MFDDAVKGLHDIVTCGLTVDEGDDAMWKTDCRSMESTLNSHNVSPRMSQRIQRYKNQLMKTAGN